MEELDTRFFEVLARFRALAESSGGRYEVEYSEDMAPVAVRCDFERYPIRPE